MLSDLIFVLNHIKKILEENNLVELYSNFSNTLQQVSQASTPELQEQLKNYKEKIRDVHELLDPSGWSHSQLEVFTRFGAREIIGTEGYTNFNKALNENAANLPGAIEELNRQKGGISQLQINAQNILSSLGGLVEEQITEEGKTVVEIVFDESVAINNLPELLNQSERWNRIIRAYSMLAKAAPEDTIIIAANKSNPFSLWMTTLPLISKAFYHTVKPFIDLWHEVLGLKEHAVALEEKQVLLSKKKFELFKDIDEYERKKRTEIMEEVGSNYHLENMTQAEINDAKAALHNAGPELYEFITGGGKVDTTKDGEGNGISGNFQLEPDYQKVHKLKEHVQKLLEAKNKREEEEEKKEKKQKVDNKSKPKKGETIKKITPSQPDEAPTEK